MYVLYTCTCIGMCVWMFVYAIPVCVCLLELDSLVSRPLIYSIGQKSRGLGNESNVYSLSICMCLIHAYTTHSPPPTHTHTCYTYS